jgi:D-aminopeptidase
MIHDIQTIEIDEERIDAVFADLDQCHLPGAVAGIAIGGTPVYRKGFGLADMERPVVLLPTDRVRMASPHFISLLYMLLCEDGIACMDVPIGTYLPELHRVTRSVTPRQLMGHTSGIRDAFDILFQISGTGRSVSSGDLLSLYTDIDDINATADTAWIFNIGGYLILASAIERISGERLEDVARNRIFERMGMNDTTLCRSDIDVLAQSAALHVRRDGGVYEKVRLGRGRAGECGMVSTVDDMLRWLAQMEVPRVGAAMTWAAMKSPQNLANGTCTGYGLGLMSERYRGIDTLWHGGGLWGGSSQCVKVPAAALDIAIVVNRGDVSAPALAKAVLDNCLRNLEPVGDKSGGVVSSATFRSPTTGRVIQLYSSAGNPIVTIDGFEVQCVLGNDCVLRPLKEWGYLNFLNISIELVGGPANPVEIRFSEFGNTDELKRVLPTIEVDAVSIVGRYQSDSTASVATIAKNDDGQGLTMAGRFGCVLYQLEQLGKFYWKAKPLNDVSCANLSFDDHLDSFQFSTWRTRRLIFRRAA